MKDFSVFPFSKISLRHSNRAFPLHALTLLSGHSRETSADYCNDGKKEKNPYAVWQYTIAGRGRIDGQNTLQDLLPGDLMILSVPGSHAYYLPPDSPEWEFVFLVLIGREAVRITRLIEERLGRVVSGGGIPQTLSLFHELLEKLFSGEIRNPFINSSYTYRLCMAFLEEAAGIRGPGMKHSFEDLKAFMKDNLFRDIAVDEMAEIMKFSRSHFTRLFSRELGMSPRLYLEDLRMKTSADILVREGCGIKEAAARCGIYDENYFCRLFKKYFGLSPAKYRERNRP